MCIIYIYIYMCIYTANYGSAAAPLHQGLKLEGLLLALSRNGTEIKGGTALGPGP